MDSVTTTAPAALAAKMLSELTRGGFVKGPSATIDGTSVSMNTTLEAAFSKPEVVAAIRTASPAFPPECVALLERSLVLAPGAPSWGVCLQFEDIATARAVGQFEDFVKGYDRG